MKGGERVKNETAMYFLKSRRGKKEGILNRGKKGERKKKSYQWVRGNAAAAEGVQGVCNQYKRGKGKGGSHATCLFRRKGGGGRGRMTMGRECSDTKKESDLEKGERDSITTSKRKKKRKGGVATGPEDKGPGRKKDYATIGGKKRRKEKRPVLAYGREKERLVVKMRGEDLA